MGVQSCKLVPISCFHFKPEKTKPQTILFWWLNTHETSFRIHVKSNSFPSSVMKSKLGSVESVKWKVLNPISWEFFIRRWGGLLCPVPLFPPWKQPFWVQKNKKPSSPIHITLMPISWVYLEELQTSLFNKKTILLIFP